MHIDWTTGEPAAWLDLTLKRAGVPPVYRSATWDRSRARDMLTGWRENPGPMVEGGRGVIMFGSVGTGKSSTAALLAAEVVKARKSLVWHYVPDLLDQMLASGYRRNGIAMTLSRPDALFLDDFGVRPMSEWEVGLLDQIIEIRYRRRKAIFLTTNLDPQGFANDPRLVRMADRLRERTDAAVIAGKSMRSVT